MKAYERPVKLYYSQKCDLRDPVLLRLDREKCFSENFQIHYFYVLTVDRITDASVVVKYVRSLTRMRTAVISFQIMRGEKQKVTGWN